MKKGMKYLVLFLITVFFIELVSFTVYLIANGKVFSFKRIDRKRERILLQSQETGDLKVAGRRVPWNVSIHPYFGFGKPKGFNFLKDTRDPAQTDPDGLVVAVTGGSVSQNLFKDSQDVIKTYIEQIPAFKDKTVYMISIGHFAWKQPQQLTSLAYYLATGGRLDLLINLDGHNEVVDTLSNMQKGVNPVYPLLWYQLASNVLPADRMNLIGEIAFWQGLQFAMAKLFDAISFGVTLNVLWDLGNTFTASKVENRRIALAEIKDKDRAERPYYKYGPKRTFHTPDQVFEYFAEVWKNASLQMDRLAKGNGATYFHFLQPNQYVPSSKPFSMAENRRYFRPGKVGIGIRKGYPHLLKVSKALKAAGVQFHDITMVFKNERATVYNDMFCHLNKRGHDLVAHTMGKIIADYYEKGPAVTQR